MIPGKQYFSLMLSVEKTSSKNKDAKKNHLCVSLAVVLRNVRDSSTASLLFGEGFFPFFFCNEWSAVGRGERGRQRAARTAREGRVPAAAAAEEIRSVELSARSRKQTLSSLPNWGSFVLRASPGTELRAPSSFLVSPCSRHDALVSLPWSSLRPWPFLCNACFKHALASIWQKIIMLLFKNRLAKAFLKCTPEIKIETNEFRWFWFLFPGLHIFTSNNAWCLWKRSKSGKLI